MYPIVYSAPLLGERNRLTVFFRILLAIPWFIVISLWSIALFFTVVFAWFALVFTGRYPEGLYNFNRSFLVFSARTNGWLWLLADEFPPFNGTDDPNYPIRVLVEDPKPEYSRMKVLFRIIVGIPVMVMMYVMNLITQVVGFISWFAILFTGKLPEGLYKPLRASIALAAKGSGYFLLLTEDWPSFWVDQEDEMPADSGALAPDYPQAPPPPPPAPGVS